MNWSTCRHAQTDKYPHIMSHTNSVSHMHMPLDRQILLVIHISPPSQAGRHALRYTYTETPSHTHGRVKCAHTHWGVHGVTKIPPQVCAFTQTHKRTLTHRHNHKQIQAAVTAQQRWTTDLGGTILGHAALRTPAILIPGSLLNDLLPAGHLQPCVILGCWHWTRPRSCS